MITAALAGLLVLASGGGEAAGAALEPIGPWRVSLDDKDSCMLSRSYGAADHPIAIVFKPTLGSRYLQILMLAKDNGDVARSGKAALTLSPGGAIAGTYTSSKVPGSEQRLTDFFTDRAAFDGLTQAGTMTLDGEGRTAIIVRAGSAAVAALEQCQTKRLVELGVDPTLFGHDKPIPVALHDGPAAWFSAENFHYNGPPIPGGRVQMLASIGVDGRVKSCRVVISATPKLDKETCDILIGQGRYVPTTDAQGKPSVSWTLVSVLWNLHYPGQNLDQAGQPSQSR